MSSLSKRIGHKLILELQSTNQRCDLQKQPITIHGGLHLNVIFIQIDQAIFYCRFTSISFSKYGANFFKLMSKMLNRPID